VNFTLNPANAQVFVNRELASNSNRLELVPGVYMIEIKADKHQSQTETIEVKLGDNIRKNYTLQAMKGTLLLTVNPVDTKTELYLDNKLIRTVTGSVRVSDLFVGDYILKCSASGHKSKDFKVSIIENEAKEFNIILDKGPDVPEGMVYVEGGTFQMGSNSGDSDEKPVHSVTVSSFYIGKYEVTQKQWTEVMGSNPADFKGDNRPVESISWYQAVEFCNKLSQKEGLTPAYTFNGRNVTCNWNANGYRLPTEAEWEFAARGGNKSKGFTYAGSNSIDEVAWYYSNSGKTQPVGTKKANELGIYDMSGNVWEWCWDWKASYSSGAKTNPSGPDSGSSRVLRGGCWGNYARICHSAYRSDYYPDLSNYSYGFRLLRSSE
ncbi:MAG: formylglycine-generating enzyme family protein, partial [Candidatus Cloacimonetes bacterium]|nr:formylglycine-generating enzyme family protein [Candidatus Cloacimonadota bacterium]